jgi:hypothetical protein
MSRASFHENSFWLGRFKKMSPENRANWINRWDPSIYVGSASMPMLFVNGGKDFAYPRPPRDRRMSM